MGGAAGPRAPSGRRLGLLLCWGVVFADIGTSVYYTPGILYGQVGSHAALFVCLTLVVFVLLAIKYSEVAIRYPEGGGVVTVASRAIHPVAGLLGGLLILVDYFLTAAISALSGLIYMAVVLPQLHPGVLPLTIGALIVLGGLNLVGVKASARASAFFAVAAALGQLAVVVAVVAHLGPAHVLATVPRMLSGIPLHPLTVLTGYSGAFLAFSGLESIAQLAPSMAEPRRRVARGTMAAVVVSVAVTSPLLTLWSTTLLDARHSDPNQFVSLLGGYAAGPLLQGLVAVSAAMLLVFASNTALIGSYHVFLALARMGFLPRHLQDNNRWRKTPHWSIIVATLVPLGVLVATRADVAVLGDLYAFGLLGAFTVTCVSLDIVRWHERHEQAPPREFGLGKPTRWMLVLGIATTFLVGLAWTTNLVAKPMATLFGGIVTGAGLLIAYINHRLTERTAGAPVFPILHRHEHPVVFTARGRRLPAAAVLADVPEQLEDVDGLVKATARAAGGRPVIFLYQGQPLAREGSPLLMEVVDPYLDDRHAQDLFRKVERTARAAGLSARYIYAPTRDPAVKAGLLEALKPITEVRPDGEASAPSAV